MSDVRHQRSRDRLERAILRLAQAGPVEQITMSALAAEAGVNRSTVYEHTTSPESLLNGVLLAELDELRDRHLVAIRPDGVDDASTAVMIDVLAHLDAHEEIYRRGLGDDRRPGPLLTVLAGHFRESVRRLIAQGEIVLPADGPGPEVVARYVGDGTAAAAAIWLDLPHPRDPAEFADRFRVVRPIWWAPTTVTR